jgi:hypothetical protein
MAKNPLRNYFESRKRIEKDLEAQLSILAEMLSDELIRCTDLNFKKYFDVEDIIKKAYESSSSKSFYTFHVHCSDKIFFEKIKGMKDAWKNYFTIKEIDGGCSLEHMYVILEFNLKQ